MRKNGVEAIILMYHDLSSDDRASSERNPYVLASSVFRSHLDAARAAGFLGTTVEAWVKRRRYAIGRSRPELILTFDDGDLSIGWSVQRELNGKTWAAESYGPSENHAYVTGAPVGQNGQFETVLAVGCRGAKGLRPHNPGEVAAPA